MSRAILVLPEMPESCEKCPLRRYDAVAQLGCAATSNIILRKAGQEKPKWCPLQETPGRIDGWNAYGMGWNDAVEEIEGSGKDD